MSWALTSVLRPLDGRTLIVVHRRPARGHEARPAIEASCENRRRADPRGLGYAMVNQPGVSMKEPFATAMERT